MEGKNIYAKLLEIQQKLNVPKNNYNEFGNFNYRSCEDILNAVKPILKELNLVIVMSDDMIALNDRNYVKATARLIDVASGETVENTALAREDLEKKKMDGSQLTGASSSYARKYALNGLFAIDDVKDADATNTYGKKDFEPKPIRIAETVEEEPKQNELTIAENYAFSKGSNLKPFKDYTEAELEHVLEWARKKGNQKVVKYAELVMKSREDEEKLPWE